MSSGWIGSLASGIVDLGGSYLQNELINKPNAREATRDSEEASATAFRREHEAYKSRYRSTTHDMKEAGLNPILAATSGFNVGTGPKATMPNVYMPQTPNNSFTSSALNVAKTSQTQQDTKRSKAETQKKLKEVGLVKKQTDKAIQEIINMRAQKKLITQQEKVSLQTINNLEQQFSKMAYEISNISQKTITEQQKVQNMELVAKKLIKEIAKLNQIAKVYNGPLGNKIAYLKEIGSILNIGLLKGIK